MAQTLTAEEQAVQAQADLDQKDAQIGVLEARVRELAGYEQEVRGLRETNADLKTQVDDLNESLEAALRDANLARAEAKSTADLAGSDGGKVAAAEQIAAGIKALL